MKKIKFLLFTATILIAFSTGALAQNPKTAKLDSAKALMIEEKYNESLAVLDSALVDDSTNVNAYYYQSLCYQYLSDYQKASSALTKALSYKPDDIKMMVSLGNNLSASGQLSEAENILSKAFRLDSYNERTIMELSNLYYAKKQYLSAMRIIDGGLAVYPVSSEFWTRKGDILLGMKKYSIAINCYDYSLRLGDSSFTNYKNGGLCFYLTEKYDSAVIFLGNAVKLNKKDPTSYFYLGASYKEMKEYNEAIKSLFAALKLLKSNYLPEVYTQLASSYYSLNDYKKALEYYKEALEEGPEKFQINLYLASVYEHLYKDKSVAMRYYKKFLADSAEADKKLVEYAKDKLAVYTEEKFMNQKR